MIAPMTQQPTIAVIDVGSNSIKLLVACRGETPESVTTRFAETIETRISEGISKAVPRLNDQAIREGCATIAELVRLAREYHPSEIRIVATSAVRDAVNGDEFREQVSALTGIDIRILTGHEEATYIGKGLAADPHVAGIRDFIQMDIGGGSLELIRFRDARIDQAISLQLGAVRMTERFVENRDEPVSPETEARLQAHVRDELARSGFAFTPVEAPLIATGGTFVISRAILAAEAGITLEDRSPVVQRAEITRLKKKLAHLPLHERMAVPHLPAARADIFPAALATVEQVMRSAGRETLTLSFYNLRYGIASAMLASQSPA